jgi:hypothetical protein
LSNILIHSFLKGLPWSASIKLCGEAAENPG